MSVSCGEPIREVVTEQYKNGNRKLVVLYKGEGFDEMVVGKIRYYQNGQKKFQERFEDGIKTGLSTYWYENGQKKGEGKYVKGKMNGMWTFYRDNGRVFGKGSYNYGDGSNIASFTRIPKNNRTGEWIFYKDDGNIRYKGIWRNGQLDVMDLYVNGKLFLEELFHNGKLSDLKIWRKNGESILVSIKGDEVKMIDIDGTVIQLQGSEMLELLKTTKFFEQNFQLY